jgi:hypothetical protein
MMLLILLLIRVNARADKEKYITDAKVGVLDAVNFLIDF